MNAVKGIIPKPHVHEITFTRNALQGYYDNPILLFKAIIRKESVVKAFIENLANRLEVEEKKRLLSEIESHINGKGTLYLRMDKQEAFLGNIRFGQTDPIHIKIRLRKKMKEPVSIYRTLGLLP